MLGLSSSLVRSSFQDSKLINSYYGRFSSSSSWDTDIDGSVFTGEAGGQNAGWSVSMWIKPDDGQPTSNQDFFGMYDSGGFSDDFITFTLQPSGKLFSFCKFDSSGFDDSWKLSTNAAVFANGATDWTHVVWTCTLGASGSSTVTNAIYVNKVAQVFTQYGGGVITAAMNNFDCGGELNIGGSNVVGTSTVTNPYEGDMDEIMFFDGVLQQTHIDDIYDLRSNATGWFNANATGWAAPTIHQGYRFEADTSGITGGNATASNMVYPSVPTDGYLP